MNPGWVATRVVWFAAALCLIWGCADDSPPVTPSFSHDEVPPSAVPISGYLPAGEAHFFTTSVVVPDGETLTLAPGCEMRFGVGTKLYVLGTLRAIGTEKLPVLLTAHSSWNGASLLGRGALAILFYCRIERTAPWIVEDATFLLNHSTITQAPQGLVTSSGSSTIVIENNALELAGSGEFLSWFGDARITFHGNEVQSGRRLLNGRAGGTIRISSNTISTHHSDSKLLTIVGGATKLYDNIIRGFEGPAILAVSSSVSLERNEFSDCEQALHAFESELEMSGCTFDFAIDRDQDQIRIQRCTDALLDDNTWRGSGTSIRLEDSSAILNRNVWKGSARAITIDGSGQADVRNAVFDGAASYSWPGFVYRNCLFLNSPRALDAEGGRVLNCVFLDNAIDVIGEQPHREERTELSGCMFLNGPDRPNFDHGGTLVLRDCFVDDWLSANDGRPPEVMGALLEGDPGFDADAPPLDLGDTGVSLHLLENSPCIDSGPSAREFDDPDGTRNDIGIYGGPFHMGIVEGSRSGS